MVLAAGMSDFIITLDDVIKALLLHLGMLAHFLTKLISAKTYATGKPFTLWSYWRNHPAQSLLAIVAAWAVFLMLWGSPELTRTSALAIGFMADRLLDAVGENFLRARFGGFGGFGGAPPGAGAGGDGTEKP